MFKFFRSAFFLPILLAIWSDAKAQCNVTVNAGDDIYLCAPPSPTQLDGSISGDYLSFMWTPLTGLTGANTLQPTVTVSQNATYVLSVTAADLSNNLVTNGDFESGNTGFSSDYIYSPGNLVPEGVYDVLDNPQDDHANFAPCDDHTTGAGNMMVVNGAGTPNINVWCQTVPVTPNSQYVLSAWVTSVIAASPALLQFSINGSTVGPIFSAPGTVCNWLNYFQSWNSGASSSATICIVNQNTLLSGNDFALDDIVFAPTCIVRDTVQVFVVNVVATAAPSIVTLPCIGATVTLSGAGSSVGANIAYLWDTPNGNIVSGETTLNPVVNAPGAYTLTVSYIAPDGTICTKTATVNVILSPNPLAAWITPPAPLGCGSTTTILIGNSSQSGFSAYAWTTQDGNIVSGADQKVCVVNQVGTYTLTVTNTNTGCTATAEVQVTATTNPPVANAMVSDTITCFQDTVMLTSTGSSTGNNITYSWTTTNGHFISGQNTATALVDTVGTYVLNVTNTTNNCVSRDTVKVIGNLTPPYVFLPPQQQITCTVDTIAMIVFLFPPPFVLINWTASNGGHIVSGQYTPNPQVDSAGTYSVTVQDPINGCISSGSVVVNSNQNQPVANVEPPGAITCQSPSISLSGSGSSTGPNLGYNWLASNGGNIVSGDTSLNPVVNAAGTYVLSVLDSLSGCVSADTATVSADTNVVMVIANAPDTLRCNQTTIVLNANGSSNNPNISYAWTTTNGNILSGADTPNPVVNQAGTYQLLLTNMANGCTGIDLAVAHINNTPPPISISPPAQLTCADPTLTLSASNSSPGGSFAYTWVASNGGNILSGQNTLSPVVNAPGDYTLTAINNINGCTATATTTVSISAGVPQASVSVAGSLTCVQLTQSLDGTGSSVGPSYAYQWTASNGGNIVGSSTGISATAGTAGTYVLAVSNSANGCVSFDTIVVDQNIVPPPADAGLPDTITCGIPQLSLLANGSGAPGTLLYQWNSPSGMFVGNTDSALVAVSAGGIYWLTVTDPANGCSSVDSVQVFENKSLPTLNLNAPDTLTCNLLSQDIQVQNQTLPGNFTYNWTASNGGNIVSGNNSISPNVNAPGTYLLTATNVANGCTATLSAVVMQDIATPNIQVTAPGQITCANPSQNIQAQNLSLPGNFSYNWVASNGGNIGSGGATLNPTVNTGGDYTLTTTNLANGCNSSVSTNVVQNNTPPGANAGVDATLTCNLNNLSLTGSGSGAPNLNLNWAAGNGGNIVSGNNSPNPVINAPGLYTLTVTNPANGCSATDIVEIFNDASAPAANAGTAPMLTCSLTQTTLNATASTGANFTYNWTASNGGSIINGQNTLTPTINKPGLYTLTVTNTSNGCSRTSSITVLEDITPPTVDAGANGTLTCTVASLTLAGSSSGGPATYSWQTTGGNIVSGGNTLNPGINRAGAYTLTSTLVSNGCSATDGLTIGIDTISPSLSIQQPSLLTCSNQTVSLLGTVQQPSAGNFSAAWTTGNGNILAGQSTLNATINAPGTYILTIVSTVNGCDAALAIPVFQNIIPPAAVVAPASSITCSMPSVVLSGSGSTTGNGIVYSWTGGPGGQILSGGNTLMPTVGSTGTYTLQVTNNSNGCSATATITVGSNTTPPTAIIATPGMLTCVQNSVTLNGAGSSQGANFSTNWSSSGGNIVSGQNTLAPVVNQPGTYTLTLNNSQNGCTASASVTVSQNIAAPGAEAGTADNLHCNQTQVTLNGSSPSPGNMSYAWASTNGNIVSGSAAQASIVDAPGLYTLTVTNPQNGCTATDNVNVVAVPPPSFEPTLLQPDCHNQNGMLDFGSVSGGAAPFRYSTDGGQSFSNQNLTASLPSGAYTLVVQDALGCTAVETVTVDQPFLPTLDIADVATLDIGDSILLQPISNILPGNVVSWQWSPAAGLSCSDCETPWAKPLSSALYTLVVTDNNDCTATARVQVRVNRNRNLYAPNVFSPNDDGENDYFMLFGKGVKEIQSLQVFDRWGSQLFNGEHLAANDEQAGWDGNYRGSALTPAVFVWWAKVEFVDGAVEIFYGDVTLVR
jgi:gliding motility-associated-like protein